MTPSFRALVLVLLVACARALHAQPLASAAAPPPPVPQTVQIPATADAIALTGYLYLPDPARWPGPRPAVVMLHGRSGVYSASAKAFDATQLSSRTVLWGRFWAERGYVGLYVDSFGPRGHPRGFAAGTNRLGQRPPEVNEITVRPHDAYRGLAYLRARADVRTDRVYLQGWSNGGSATLSAIHEDFRGPATTVPGAGFRAAIAFYPACRGVERHYGKGYRALAPLLLLIGTADEEVSFSACEQLAQSARQGDLQFVRYEDAQHSFDTPTRARQTVDANARAAQDSMQRAEAFFAAP